MQASTGSAPSVDAPETCQGRAQVAYRDDDDDVGSGWLQRMNHLVHRLPGAGFAQRQAEWIETRMLTELKSRMDRLDARNDAARPAPSGGHSGVSSLAEQMARLMEQAAEQSREQALTYLFEQIVRELVPDEARILGVLSDESAYPLLHIAVGPRVGPATRRIADNFTNIGKPAGVKLLEQVPAYVAHLRALGLLESGPEDKDLEIKYQILEGDVAVREVADRAAAKGSGTSVRFVRRTLRMSALGRQFWQACVTTE